MGSTAMLQSVLGALQELHGVLYSLPTLPILIGHCIFCATLAPEAKGNFLLHYLLTFAGGFCGGHLSALLIMNPEKAPLAILANNRVGITWTAVWWLMTYSPLAKLFNAIHDFKPFKITTKACVAFMRSTIIVSRVQLAAQLFPGVFITPILLGTIAACGGKCSYDIIRHIYGLATAPAEVTIPTYSFRSALLGATSFYLSCVLPATRFLTIEQGAAALTMLFLLHSMLSDLGLTFDWSETLLAAILRLANIPWPEGVPEPMKQRAVPSERTHMKAQSAKTCAAPTNGLHADHDASARMNGGVTSLQDGHVRGSAQEPSGTAPSPAASTVQTSTHSQDSGQVAAGAVMANGKGSSGPAAGSNEVEMVSMRRNKPNKAAGEIGWQVVASKGNKNRKPEGSKKSQL